MIVAALFRQPTGCHYQAVRFAEEDYANFLLCEPVDYHPSIRNRLYLVHAAMGRDMIGQATFYEFDVVLASRPAADALAIASPPAGTVDTRSNHGIATHTAG